MEPDKTCCCRVMNLATLNSREQACCYCFANRLKWSNRVRVRTKYCLSLETRRVSEGSVIILIPSRRIELFQVLVKAQRTILFLVGY